MLEDLEADKPVSKKSTLNLTKVNRYFHGPSPQNHQTKYRSSEDMLRAANSLIHEVYN